MHEIKFRYWDEGNKEMHTTENPSIHGSNPVMQYTNLKDCKGVDIYEGDILNHDFPEDPPCLCTIVFLNGAYRKFYESWDKTLPYPPLQSDDIELLNLIVIGNIYENPELLDE